MSLACARRGFRFFIRTLALGIICSQPALADARPVSSGISAVSPTVVAPDLHSLLVSRTSGEISSFYAFGPGPLWLNPDGSLDPAAAELVHLIDTASDDGLDPAAFHPRELAAAVAQAQTSGSAEARADAEVMLSRTFLDYVAALRSPGATPMVYESKQLAPHSPGPYFTLSQAAKAPSLADYIRNMSWMHPLYAPLRHALMNNQTLTLTDRQRAIANLERIRAIPDQPNGRYILLDSANAMLFMYEGDRVVDSMKVIVGKAATQTPTYAGYVRYAELNPYWNVPDNLVQSLIAKNVLAQGVKYLKRQGYEVVDGWEDDARVLDPLTIDWAAARRGDLQLHVRQLPSTFNSMGKVKYEFPNVYGIYLHDTPEKDLMEKDVRQLSNGCIRLEDAKRLGRWLMQGDLTPNGDAPEQKVDLPRPVPIYITYLTAHVDGDNIALGADPYNHDGTALASAN
jgi:murein L,D-transpeptidase YcbB/YkuD